jgi:hypothetical protein
MIIRTLKKPFTYITAFDYLRNCCIKMLHPLPYLHLAYTASKNVKHQNDNILHIDLHL